MRGKVLELPCVGRIVHFVMPGGDIRPAIIVSVCKPETTAYACNLQVFTDGANDETQLPSYERIRSEAASTDRVVWRQKVAYSESVRTGTWHWPPGT